MDITGPPVSAAMSFICPLHPANMTSHYHSSHSTLPSQHGYPYPPERPRSSWPLLATPSSTSSCLLYPLCECPGNHIHYDCRPDEPITMPNDVPYRGTQHELNSCALNDPPICPWLFANAIAKADLVAPSVVCTRHGHIMVYLRSCTVSAAISP